MKTKLLKLAIVCIATTAYAEEGMREKIDHLREAELSPAFLDGKNIDFLKFFESSPFFFDGEKFTTEEGLELSQLEQRNYQLVKICSEALEGKLQIEKSARAFVTTQNIDGKKTNIIYIQNFLKKGVRGGAYAAAVHVNEKGEVTKILAGS